MRRRCKSTLITLRGGRLIVTYYRCLRIAMRLRAAAEIRKVRVKKVELREIYEAQLPKVNFGQIQYNRIESDCCHADEPSLVRHRLCRHYSENDSDSKGPSYTCVWRPNWS